jgi:hypothetical protein
MKIAFPPSRSGVRRIGLAAAFAAALLGTPVSAEAKSSSAPLQAGPAGAEAGATGRVRIQSRVRGDRVKVTLRDLEPLTAYEVRDGATDSVLAAVTTNRRGRARASFRAETLPGGGTVSLAGLPLEICRPGEDEPVLEGRVPGGEDGGNGGDDRPEWDDCSYRIGQVSTGAEAEVQVSLVLTSTGVPGRDGTYDSMSVFASPNSWIAWIDGGEFREEPYPISGPLTLWIADDEGALVKVATLESSDSTDLPCPGGIDGDAGANALGIADAGVAGMVEGGKDDGGVSILPGEFHWWYADNASEEGLPFGVGGVDDLVGRAFEVRDAREVVLLGGEVPALETIDCSPPPPDDFTWESGTVSTDPDARIAVSITMSSSTGGGLDGPYDSISLFVSPNLVFVTGPDGMPMRDGGSDPAWPGIPGPVAFLVEGADGELVLVAKIEPMEGGIVPLDGGMGMNGFPDGGEWTVDAPPFYSWYADNLSEGGLPLGVERVARLSGRRFEVRDGERTLLLGGVLPELEAPSWDDPVPGGMNGVR